MAWYDPFVDAVKEEWKEDPFAVIGTGVGLLGGLTAGSGAESAAAAQTEAARLAAEAAAFKPYAVTTGLGTSYFDPESQTAGYTLDPALAAWRDAMMQSASTAMPSTFDTTEAAKTYYDEMQGILAPARQAENLQMQQDMFGSGRLGMRLAGQAAGAGTGMVQPDVFGLNQARSQADAALAQAARTQAQTELDQSIARGTGLLQTGLGIEQLGLTPLELGGTFGGYGSSAGSAQANALLTGGLGAAQANLAAGMNRSNLLGQLGAGLLKYNK